MLATLLAAWVQYGADGHAHARVATTDACPTITVDGAALAMQRRAAPDAAFASSACDLALPPGVRAIAVGGRALPVPVTAPRRIVVLGDTGCRIAKKAVQACNDPIAWPFASIAAAVATEKPDLIVHVGDYLYREAPCPATTDGCGGSPSGDTWASWNADWFAPAGALQAAAPLVLVRGNHESCKRAGTGWFRYLEASNATTCTEQTAPYAIDIGGGLRLVVFDDSFADDAGASAAAVATYAPQVTAARALARGESWLVTHRPPYLNATMIGAAPDGYAPFGALLAGHIHLFAAMNATDGPPLLINGTGGDALSKKAELDTSAFFLGARVRIASEVDRFGYAVYDRATNGWSVTLHDAKGGVLQRCMLTTTVRCG